DAPRRGSAWLLAVMLIQLSVATAFASQGVSIAMKATAEVQEDTVRLSDIAVLSGAPSSRLKALGDTIVGSAPQPGQMRFVGIAYVRLCLRKAGFDTDALVFDGPEDVRISRPAAALPAERIRADVVSAIRRQMPWRHEQVTIDAVTFDENLQLPTGKLTYRIVPNRNEDFLGSTLLGLHLFVDGVPLRRIWVNATISVKTDVVAVVRPLGKFQHIEREDLAVESRDLADLPADTVRRVEDALGNRTTRMIYPGTILQEGMFDAPPLVKRGDIVKIVADTGSMTITATGLVTQQGRRGEMVRVMNTHSKRVVLARVTGPGAVEVEF
ncbi:MAG TPA: flagellar basal body P-ring formation chaperone FlgA, partial [Desulfosarcina sp.]|nr:flagellar basal body P-ring formation chaperone FlgA [Desulfosarcina sp.]